MLRRATIAAVVGVLALTGAPAAWGHAEYDDSRPPRNGEVAEVPRRISLSLTEPPAAGGRMSVTDGCGDEVGGPVEITGNTMEANISGGRGSRWTVAYRVISTVDGHPTKDTFSFRVGNAEDCDSQPAPRPTDNGPVAEPPADGGSLPIVPVAVGAVVLVGLAVLARKAAG